MKSQIIKSLMVTILLLMATRSLSAWQTSGIGAEGTGPAVDPTVVPDDSTLNESSKTLPVPNEHRDSAFVWNIAFRAYRNQGGEREKLELSEQQASSFRSLCGEYSDWTTDFLKRRDTPDDGVSSHNEKTQTLQAEAYNRMAIFRQDFLATLTNSQRDDVYRQTLKNGGAFALLHPELRTRFQLTEDQVQKITEIRDINWEPLSPHFMTTTDAHYRTKAEPFMEAAWGKLTDDQKLQFEQFTGKQFKSDVARVPDETTSLFGGTSQQVPSGRVVQGGSVMITWSENNDELRGFSSTLGEWETLRITKQDSVIPVVSDAVAAVRIGDSIAAFSSVKGWWDVIALSKNSAAQPIVSSDVVQIEDNGHLYTFAAAKGRWTSPTDTDLQSASSELRLQSGLKLQQQAQRLDEWFSSLPRYKARGIVFNFTRELGGRVSIQTARRSWLKEAEDKLNELAAQPEPKTTSDAAANSAQGPVDATDLDSRIAGLREELQSLDAHVNRGADRPFSKDEAQDNREQALRGLVEQAFDLRQQLQRLEAQRMQLKLKLIEANLDAREKNREVIINRRTEEVISGAAGSTSTQTAAPRPELRDVELLFFTAAYCGPCQQVAPRLKKLQNEGFPITFVDISADPETTRSHKIDRIPTCVLKFDGFEVRRLVGLVSEAELRKEFVRPAGKQHTSSVAVKSLPESSDNPTESESSAPIGGSSGSTSRRKSNVRTPAEFVAELRKLRQAVSEHATAQKAAENSLTQISRPLAELKAEGLPYADGNDASRDSFRKKLEQNVESSTIALDRATRDWQLGWSEYQSHLRMLKLDIDEVKLVLEQLHQKLDRVKQLHAKGVVPRTEVQEVESPLAIARIDLQRAEELLKLYADIETKEPALNPASLRSEK